nr:retrovirus-related Pol polyprotein from transposon TNT 1-94 [Tanacetum cinerariifolium]
MIFARNDLVAGLPKLKYHKEHLCPSCEQGKSKRASHLPKPVPNSRQRLHLLHRDLCGPMRITSINGKRYVLVIVDDYSRYTWNGVVERRNQTLVEAARTMLIFSRAPLLLWAEAIATASTGRNVPPASEPQVRQTSMASTTIADTAPIPTNSSSHAKNVQITSQDVDELNPNAMIDGNTFVNPFTNPSTSAATASSSQKNVDPSNMHTFYQPYPHKFPWTKDHPLEQVIGEPS